MQKSGLGTLGIILIIIGAFTVISFFSGLFGGDSLFSPKSSLQELTPSISYQAPWYCSFAFFSNSRLCVKHTECIDNSCTLVKGPGTIGCSPLNSYCAIEESVLIAKSSDNLNLGETLTDVWTGSIDDDDLPERLGDSTYTPGGGSTVDTEQKITLSEGLLLRHFRDSDYEDVAGLNERTPVIGIKMSSNQGMFKYVLDFLQDPFSTISNNKLNNFEDTELDMMGDTYIIINTVANPMELTLQDSAGNIFELRDNLDVKKNEDTVNGLVTHFYPYEAVGGIKLDKIELEWKTDEEMFIAPEVNTPMPAFETFDFSFGEFVTVHNENTAIQKDGDQSMELEIPIKDGTVNINFLFSDPSGDLVGIGKDVDERLATSNTNVLEFFEKDSFGGDYDDYFVASYSTQSLSESYLLRAKITSGGNVDIEKNIGGQWQIVCNDKNEGDVCDIGSVSLTISSVTYNPGGEESVTLTAGTYVNFNKIYTKQGLEIQLPYEGTGTANGVIDFTGGAQGHSSDSFYLFMIEEDKDEKIAQGEDFYFTIDDNTDNNLQVKHINGAGTGGPNGLEIGNTNSYETYIVSHLATKIVHHTNPDEDWAELFYHGEEAYGQVYLNSFP